jgi:hypothetical protein
LSLPVTYSLIKYLQARLGLIALPTNIRLGGKKLTVTITLADNKIELIMAVKSFMTQT